MPLHSLVVFGCLHFVFLLLLLFAEYFTFVFIFGAFFLDNNFLFTSTSIRFLLTISYLLLLLVAN